MTKLKISASWSRENISLRFKGYKLRCIILYKEVVIFYYYILLKLKGIDLSQDPGIKAIKLKLAKN